MSSTLNKILPRYLLSLALLGVFSASPALAGIPAWKIHKWSPLQGDCYIYTSAKMSKIVEQKSGMISIFDNNPKFMTSVNLAKKTYHRENFDTMAKMTSLLTNISDSERSKRKWIKQKRHKLVAGKDCVGYKCYSATGQTAGEAWYFVERKCPAGVFLAKIFDVPPLDIELGELTWYKSGKPRPTVRTLSVEKVSLEPDFFAIPKDCKKDAGRFGVMNGGLEGIEGIADDLMGQESRQFHSEKATPKLKH